MHAVQHQLARDSLLVQLKSINKGIRKEVKKDKEAWSNSFTERLVEVERAGDKGQVWSCCRRVAGGTERSAQWKPPPPSKFATADECDEHMENTFDASLVSGAPSTREPPDNPSILFGDLEELVRGPRAGRAHNGLMCVRTHGRLGMRLT